jgi:hypothetical protein
MKMLLDLLNLAPLNMSSIKGPGNFKARNRAKNRPGACHAKNPPGSKWSRAVARRTGISR